jgi:NADH-quinone oxidoreductase subunit C
MASAQRVGEGLTGAIGAARWSVEFDQLVVDVPVGSWVAAAAWVRERAGFDYFDWLSAVDAGDGEITVVAHLWSLPQRTHLLLRTTLTDGQPLPSLTGQFAGAGWHERETAEMFGVDITGFDDGTGQGLRPLLLGEGAPPHPLRRSASAGSTPDHGGAAPDPSGRARRGRRA